jgi:predicted Ser/Thr protein kinase
VCAALPAVLGDRPKQHLAERCWLLQQMCINHDVLQHGLLSVVDGCGIIM